MPKKTKSGLEHVLGLPWQAHIVVGAVAMAISAFLPDIVRYAALAPLVKVIAQLAWFVAFAFVALGVATYAIKRYREEHPFGLVMPTADDAAAANKAKRPAQWSLELLRELEWKHFEALCGAYYGSRGFRLQTIRRGADGTIDATLTFKDLPDPVAIVRCKGWSGRVGAEAVRELVAVMAHNKVGKGIFHATGTYSAEALALAQDHPIQLKTGSDFVQEICQLPDAAQKDLLNIATDGDYTTPICPACGSRMVMRNSGQGFLWGCAKSPRCTQTLALRDND